MPRQRGEAALKTVLPLVRPSELARIGKSLFRAGLLILSKASLNGNDRLPPRCLSAPKLLTTHLPLSSIIHALVLAFEFAYDLLARARHGLLRLEHDTHTPHRKASQPGLVRWT